MKKAVVIGGGITGLSAMYYLQKLNLQENLDLELVLVEQEQHLGGKIRTVTDDEFVMEVGADSIVARHASVMPLIEDLGIADRVVYNGTGISYLYANNVLHAIPKDTVFGIPMDKEALFRSTLVSEEGKQAAMKDFDSANENFTRDSSIGEFLEAFLGKELVENQIAPVLSGVYSGSLHELTLASTLPYLVDYKNKYGSIIKGFEANKEFFQGAANKKFISFDEGMRVLIDEMENQLEQACILKGVGTKSVQRDGEQYLVELENGEVIEADYVILATPHQVAQRLLGIAELDTEFDQFLNSSLISVYLGYDVPDDQLPKDGTGFIVSQESDLHCNACTWTSRKWRHTSKKHNLLVRLFYKSSHPSYGMLNDLSEEELAKVAREDVRKSLGVEEAPIAVEVTGWKNLMPNYHMAHKTAISALELKMEELVPNVKLAGSSYFGVGIGACIQNGSDLAKIIANQLVDVE
ncbi:oxygen-dependent protoporphyrinogen oxidase [Planomicrobium stackebrandtii]|uniref:Coproporphyrinogen III oxidase n=1 Tax=Planomicrobium stackebrandtii TaxID=253160 RepID=A0ABU0GWS4_9BACL|nr:protoporphyrinogen oxidase [Planomicrobium stackebrandtii]MDQ0429821.1 oxygen-dependent protoporphyrinogen oxidase [Planomicrobium stackebrandtii]